MTKFRSKFEARTAEWFKARGIRFKFEATKLAYAQRAVQCECVTCGSKAVVKNRRYTPDFIFPGKSFYLETKGRMTSAERTKLTALRNKYDIRLVFQRNNRIAKNSTTTYAQWAELHGIQYSVGVPDIKWFGENKSVRKRRSN